MCPQRLRSSVLIVLLLVISSCLPLNAQVTALSGSVRERTEIDARSFTPGAHQDVFHLLRTRLAATATIADWLIATVEVQDSRAFGQSRATLNGSAPAFDLRQGNVEIRDIAATGINMKLGRQVLNYNNERLIGRSDWNNFGQSFDGLFTSVQSGDVRVDAFGMAVARNPNTPDYHRDVFLTGLWGTYKEKTEGTHVQAFYLFDNPGNDTTRDNRHTAGVYFQDTLGAIDIEADGAYQFGKRIRKGSADRTIGAHLAGIRAGYTFADLSNFRIGVGFDRLSGLEENAPDKFGAFNTLYGTNHKFYGQIDIVDNTTQRQDLGLNDPFVELSIVPWKNTRIAAEVHMLSLASDPAKVVPNAPANVKPALGKELDIVVRYTPIRPLTVMAGYAVFDGDPDRYLFRGRKTIQWGFAMINVTW